MKSLKYLALATLFVAYGCSTGGEQTSRTKVSGGIEYSAPTDESKLPTIELYDVEEQSFSLASCASGDRNCISAENQKLWELLMTAGQKIKDGVYSGNNVYAAGIGWSNRNGKTVTRCVKVQIQQRKGGSIIVKDTLVPTGQAEECRTDSLDGLSTATLAVFAKVYGNNYAAGIGVGAVLYQNPYIVGCAAGAVGYASETYQTSYGTAGAFCTQIYDVNTGAAY